MALAFFCPSQPPEVWSDRHKPTAVLSVRQNPSAFVSCFSHSCDKIPAIIYGKVYSGSWFAGERERRGYSLLWRRHCCQDSQSQCGSRNPKLLISCGIRMSTDKHTGSSHHPPVASSPAMLPNPVSYSSWQQSHQLGTRLFRHRRLWGAFVIKP